VRVRGVRRSPGSWGPRASTCGCGRGVQKSPQPSTPRGTILRTYAMWNCARRRGTTDVSEAVASADAVVVATPSQAVRDAACAMASDLPRATPVDLACKG